MYISLMNQRINHLILLIFKIFLFFLVLFLYSCGSPNTLNSRKLVGTWKFNYNLSQTQLQNITQAETPPDLGYDISVSGEYVFYKDGVYESIAAITLRIFLDPPVVVLFKSKVMGTWEIEENMLVEIVGYSRITPDNVFAQQFIDNYPDFEESFIRPESILQWKTVSASDTHLELYDASADVLVTFHK